LNEKHMSAQHSTSNWSLAKTGVTAGLTGLAFMGTMVVRVPVPATTGYFNLGDIFVILAALWLGPRAGFAVGLIGPTIADAIGYPQFIPATAITKGLEGLIAGLIAYGDTAPGWRKALGALTGASVMVVGYFTFEAFVYPAIGATMPFFKVTTLQAALVEVPINMVQGAIGAAVGFGLWKAVSGVDLRRKKNTP
jgi:uncharacterized membrane protein